MKISSIFELDGLYIGTDRLINATDCQGKPSPFTITTKDSSLLLISCKKTKAPSHNMVRYVRDGNYLKRIPLSKRDYDELEYFRKW